MRKILVTSALVYANGPMHLGHILEQIQADIWVRFQKLRGIDCLYLSGDDAHGTPIMIAAQKNDLTPEELIAQSKKSHEQDTQGFLIDFSSYHTTHSEENRELTLLIYGQLKKNNDIEVKTIDQVFDEEVGIFLPDRYVKGTCPRCGLVDQYGDNCEGCGSTYSPADLLNPISILSGKPPVQKASEHYFFKLEKYADFLRSWTEQHLAPEVVNKLNEWLLSGLKSWDISRDAPYFGFAIPGVTNKYFYVWLDAPIGYLASFKHLSLRQPLDFDEYFDKDSKVELYHFIGKDITYFHTLFWPAILEGVGFRKPTSVFIHGFLTVNGQKMSKSRGTFILAQNYLKHLNPEYLRYYLASKLGAGIDDVDLNFDDFIKKNNGDLVGKVINIASRSAKFINDNFQGMLADHLDMPMLFDDAVARAPKIEEAYEQRNYNSAVRVIMELADVANQYIDEQKPWVLAKANPKDPRIQAVATMGLNLYRLLIVFLKPIVPELARDSEQFLRIAPLQWQDCREPLLNHSIDKFNPLMNRIDPKCVEQLLNSDEKK